MARTTSLLALLLVPAALVGCNEPTHMGRKLSSWTTDLSSDVDYKRRQACEAIGKMGPEAKRAIPDLIRLLEDVNEGVQEFAEEALTKMGPGAVPPLEQTLKREEPALRLHAAAAIAGIDPGHQNAGKALVAAVTGIGNAALADKARGVLVKMGAHAVPLLTPQLGDAYAPVRLQVVKVLAALKSDARAAVEPLAKLAKEDPDAQVRESAVKAIAAIGPREAAEPLLRGLLEDEDEKIAAVAGDMLVYIGARDSASGNEAEAAEGDAAEGDAAGAEAAPVEAAAAE